MVLCIYSQLPYISVTRRIYYIKMSCNVTQVMVIESLNVIGMSMLVFQVLPHLDNSLMALGLLTSIAFLPGLLNIFHRPAQQTLKPIQIILDILAFAAQISVLIFIPLTTKNDNVKWSAPLACFLISMSWWETYVDKDLKLGTLGKNLALIKKRVMRAKTKLYMICSLWKIALAIPMMLAFATQDYTIEELFAFSDKYCATNEIGTTQISNMNTDWVYVWVINVSSALVAYFTARTAAKIAIQRFSYAFPMFLATPLVFSALVGLCETWNDNQCAFAADLPSYYFWDCYSLGNLGNLFTGKYYCHKYFK